MGIIEIFLIGIGLSMDAAAVSASNALCYKTLKLKDYIVIALSFGLFQGLMPLIGYYSAGLFSDLFKQFDHWVALILLVLIGGKMLYEAIFSKDDNDSCNVKGFTYKMLMIQAIATSIDALAIGVSFVGTINTNIFLAVSIIAITTFIISLIALYLGKKFGTLLNKKAEIFGGIILIGIGLKIFLEHTLAG